MNVLCFRQYCVQYSVQVLSPRRREFKSSAGPVVITSGSVDDLIATCLWFLNYCVESVRFAEIVVTASLHERYYVTGTVV